jgi:hypothetical protein
VATRRGSVHGDARGGRDLQEIYDWEDNWDLLYGKVAETVGDISDESPVSMRESLNEAGWTDDAIWQAHLDICTEQVQVQEQTIRNLRKEEQDHELALQVQKIGCMPDTYDLERLLKYEGSIEKQFYKAIDQLERLQRLRAGDNVPAPVKIDLQVDAKEGE